jgi:phosphatidylglycerol lysyltransferase
LLPITGFGRYFADSIYMVGAATTGYAFLMIVRPVLLRQQAGEDQRTRAQQTVAAFGRSSLARFTLFPDKAYFFSNAGTMLAFVAKGRIALVLGDPIGSEGDFSPALDEFKQYCQRNDWQPAFYQVLPDHLPEYQRAGFSTLCIGHEAIVTLSNFTLEGSAAKPLRNIYNKITRLGYEPHMYLPPHRPELIQELRAISDEWLTSVHGTEKRFSLGWFDEDYLAGSPIIAVQAEDGSIKAFANVIPEYQRNEIAVDMMRRRNQLEAGTMDFLFISLLQWAQQQGYDTFNLGLSALAGVGERQDDPAVERALHYIFEHVNQFYNFKGLHAFKEKFSPQWSPRYLIYPSPASLPAIAMALMRADSGDDFLWGYLKS